MFNPLSKMTFQLAVTKNRMYPTFYFCAGPRNLVYSLPSQRTSFKAVALQVAGGRGLAGRCPGCAARGGEGLRVSVGLHESLRWWPTRQLPSAGRWLRAQHPSLSSSGRPAAPEVPAGQRAGRNRLPVRSLRFSGRLRLGQFQIPGYV